MESETHQCLKVGAVQLLLRSGCAAATTEVRCPIARHRVDVAGYLDPLPKVRRNGVTEPPGGQAGFGTDLRLARDSSPRTVIVECKQSRGDFLTDTRETESLLAERARLERVRGVLEEQIVKVCEPHLRRSGSRLFAELEEWDFGKSRVASYRGVLNDLRRIDERMYGERKFWTMAHYRLADWLYIAAPAGMIRPQEVPTGWGLIEMHGPRVRMELRVRVAAPAQTGRLEHRQRLLRNIAVAASRRGLAVGDEAESGSTPGA